MSRFGSTAVQRAAQKRRFFTSFAGTESPISESNFWRNDGIDWGAVQTVGGSAFGVSMPSAFGDPYATCQGTWGPDTEIITTIDKGTTSGTQEVEHHHRVTQSAHSVFLYEMNAAHDAQYLDFVQWQGALGTQISDFRFIVPSLTYSIPGGINDGDRLRTRCVGNRLDAWIEHASNVNAGWIPINTSPVFDTAGAGGGAVLTSGNPGMGFFKTSGSGAMNQYGFKDYLAQEL